MISETQVIEIVVNALEVKSNLISIDTSSENTEEWDSLAHLTILVELDRHLNGRASNINELASATSVSLIMEILAINHLKSDG